MKYLFSLFLFSMTLVFTACNPSAIYKPAQIELKSVNDWPGFYLSNYQKLQSIDSEARISIEAQQMATNITVELIFTAPDTLFLKAEGPFGMDLGKIFIARHRFVLYNQFNNQFVTGSLDDEYYNTFLQTDFSFSELKHALIGMAPLPIQVKLADPDSGIFISRKEDQLYRYRVDLNTGHLKTFEIEEEDQVVFRQEFLNYALIDDLSFPRFSRIVLPQKKEMVAIYHKNIKINQKIQKDRYSIEIGPKTKQLIIGY